MTHKSNLNLESMVKTGLVLLGLTIGAEKAVAGGVTNILPIFLPNGSVGIMIDRECKNSGGDVNIIWNASTSQWEMYNSGFGWTTGEKGQDGRVVSPNQTVRVPIPYLAKPIHKDWMDIPQFAQNFSNYLGNRGAVSFSAPYMKNGEYYMNISVELFGLSPKARSVWYDTKLKYNENWLNPNPNLNEIQFFFTKKAYEDVVQRTEQRFRSGTKSNYSPTSMLDGLRNSNHPSLRKYRNA